jgi:hypothetical protein
MNLSLFAMLATSDLNIKYILFIKTYCLNRNVLSLYNALLYTVNKTERAHAARVTGGLSTVRLALCWSGGNDTCLSRLQLFQQPEQCRRLADPTELDAEGLNFNKQLL